MHIVELTYKKPLVEIDKHLAGHRAFLDTYYAQGIFIASGPKEPRDGGIIITLADRATLNKILPEDPFYTHDLADYSLTEFVPNRNHAALDILLKD